MNKKNSRTSSNWKLIESKNLLSTYVQLQILRLILVIEEPEEEKPLKSRQKDIVDEMEYLKI